VAFARDADMPRPLCPEPWNIRRKAYPGRSA
jgi:hypothetical protein